MPSIARVSKLAGLEAKYQHPITREAFLSPKHDRCDDAVTERHRT
jgi:hypothetical protein